MSKNKGLIIEFWDFMKKNKAWWLAPAIILLLLVGILIIYGQSSAVSHFVYVLF